MKNTIAITLAIAIVLTSSVCPVTVTAAEDSSMNYSVDTHDVLEYDFLYVEDGGKEFLLERYIKGESIIATVKELDGTIVFTACSSNGENIGMIFDKKIYLPEDNLYVKSGGWGPESTYTSPVGVLTSVTLGAVAIVTACAGITLPVAVQIAEAALSIAAGMVYARVRISYRYDSVYQYVRRIYNFYISPAGTSYFFYGPVETHQKKALDGASSIFPEV